MQNIILTQNVPIRDVSHTNVLLADLAIRLLTVVAQKINLCKENRNNIKLTSNKDKQANINSQILAKILKDFNYTKKSIVNKPVIPQNYR